MNEGRVHLIGNPTGGSSRTRYDPPTLRSEYAAIGHDLVDLTGGSAEETSDNLILALREGSVERLVVAGGDGLVNLAIQHLAEKEIPLGLLPMGTGNDFATALGVLDRDVAGTVGAARPVDLIEVRTERGAERTWIATVAILGFPAAINDRANRFPIGMGSLVYTVAALLELPRFRRLSINLTVDGADIEIDSALLAIGNTKYFGGGMLVCPDAEPDDGQLHVTSIEGVGRLGILAHLARKSGGSADRPEVRRMPARRVAIETGGLDLWGDGEFIAKTPMTLTVRHGVLRVAGTNSEH